MEVMMHQDKAVLAKSSASIIRGESLLKLPEKDAAAGEDGMHYSWNQIKPSLQIIEEQGKRIAPN
jgi:hypothetical protein